MAKQTMIAPALFILILVVFALYFFGLPRSAEDRRAKVAIRGREFHVDIADTPALQMQGLSGRPSLGENEGMLFVFPENATRTFWMKDMNFPIDIIWIKDERIIGVAEHATPEPEASLFTLTRYESPGHADKVLEVSAGMFEEYGFAPGDAVEIRR